MSAKLPFSAPYDLATLPEKGAEIRLTPSAAERGAVAEWLGIGAVGALTALVRLSRKGRDLYIYEAAFEADVVQACVVTLEPVPSHLTGEFARGFRVRSPISRRRGPEGRGTKEPVTRAEGEISLFDPDDPDMLNDSILDLAGPVLEELSLSLDPYPRAPGAKFEAPRAADAPTDNPFVVLKALKQEDAPRPPGPAKPKRKR